eukprot:sb/3474419/
MIIQLYTSSRELRESFLSVSPFSVTTSRIVSTDSLLFMDDGGLFAAISPLIFLALTTKIERKSGFSVTTSRIVSTDSLLFMDDGGLFAAISPLIFLALTTKIVRLLLILLKCKLMNYDGLGKADRDEKSFLFDGGEN